MEDRIEPPIFYERGCDGVPDISKLDHLKIKIENELKERLKCFFAEKKTFCLKEGLTPDEVNFVLTKAIQQNLASFVPLTEQEDLEELIVKNVPLTQTTQNKFPAAWPLNDDQIPENAFSL